MEKTLVKLTWEEWVEQFKPIKNHLNANASLDGYEFEYGHDNPEQAYAWEYHLAHPGCVWTCTCSGEYQVISEGWSIVDRMGYLITEKPADPNCAYLVDEDFGHCPNCGADLEEGEDLDECEGCGEPCCKRCLSTHSCK